MNSVAGLLLLITGESAPALAAINKVQGGLAGLQGSVKETNIAGNLVGGLTAIGRAVAVAGAIAAGAATVFGVASSEKLIEAGHAAFDMSEKFGLAKGKATEWIAAAQMLGIGSSTIGAGFKFLARNLESIDLLNNTAKVKEMAKEQKIWNDAIAKANQDLQSHNPTIRAHALAVKQAAEAKIADARAALQAAEANRPFQAVMDQLGITTHDASGKVRDMNDVMLDVADAFKKLPDGADKAGLAMKIFGRSGVEMIPILDQGRAGLKAYMEQAKEMGATMTDSQVDTAQKAYLAQQKLTVAWQGASSMLGMYFLPVLTSVFTYMTSTAIPAAIRFGQWLAPSLQNALAWVRDEFIKAWPYIKKFGDELIAAWPYVQKITASVRDDLVPAFKLLLPFVVAAAMWLGSNLAPALKLVADHMNILKPILYTVVTYWVLWNAAMTVTKTLAVITSLPGMIAKLIPSLLGLSGALDVLGISEVAAFWPLIAVVAIIAGVILIGVLLITHWKQISTTVRDLGVLLGTFFVEVWNKVRNAVGAFFSGIGSKVQDGLKAIGGAFSALGTTVHNIWNTIVSKVEEAARAFWERPFYWITRVVLFIPALLLGLEIRIGTWARDVAMHAWKAGGDFFSHLGTWLSKLPGWIQAWATDVINRFSKWAANLLAWGHKAAQDFLNAVVDWIAKLPEKVGTWLAQIITDIGTWAGKLSKAAKDAFQGLVDAVWDLITKTDWGALGGNILRGIGHGIVNAINAVVGWAGPVANQIIQGFKDAFGITSPSMVMAVQIGKPIAEGVAVGITQNAGTAKGALGDLVGGLSIPSLSLRAGGLTAARGLAGMGQGASETASNRDLLEKMLARLEQTCALLHAIATDTAPMSGQHAALKLG